MSKKEISLIIFIFIQLFIFNSSSLAQSKTQKKSARSIRQQEKGSPKPQNICFTEIIHGSSVSDYYDGAWLSSIFNSSDTIFLVLYAKKQTTISRIYASNKLLKLINKRGADITNLNLSERKDTIGIIYSPNRGDVIENAYLMLQGKSDSIKVNLNLSFADISGNNFNQLSSLTINKKVNSKLYIERITLLTFFALYDHPLKDNEITMATLHSCADCLLRGYTTDTGHSNVPLDLSKINPGTYYLAIACEGDNPHKSINIVVE
jgi:hypothetical protein